MMALSGYDAVTSSSDWLCGWCFSVHHSDEQLDEKKQMHAVLNPFMHGGGGGGGFTLLRYCISTQTFSLCYISS